MDLRKHESLLSRIGQRAAILKWMVKRSHLDEGTQFTSIPCDADPMSNDDLDECPSGIDVEPEHLATVKYDEVWKLGTKNVGANNTSLHQVA